MILKDFACLLVNTSRAKAYIQKLIRHSFIPANAIYLDVSSPVKERSETDEWVHSPRAEAIQKAFQSRKYFLYSQGPQTLLPVSETPPAKYCSFDPQKGVLDSLKEARIDFQIVRATSVNDVPLLNVVKTLPERYILFSGGGILREDILGMGKTFIHIHPGFLPHIRGSMAVEWSLLVGHRVAASALFMAEHIDAGDILMTKFFDPPELENGGIPPYYSPHIRSELLLDLVREYVRTGEFRAQPQSVEEGETYYKMHPMLNNLVFWKLNKPSVTQ